MRNFIKKIDKHYIKTTFFRENKVVLNFFKNLPNNSLYFEAGSGMGRFPKIVREMFGFKIICIEINKNLANLTQNNGFKTINGNILQTGFDSNKFNIVHCSHIIEHFKYPEVSHALDEILRITKDGGFVIIRSPLMHPDFYLDIDHVRPYPPDCILNYFKNKQQQRVGKHKIREIKRWHRRSAVKIRILERFRITRFINTMLKLFWIIFKFPVSKKDGYILILQKSKK